MFIYVFIWLCQVLIVAWELLVVACVLAKSLHSCLTVGYPWTGSSVHGILQAFPFSKGSSQPRDQTQVSTLQVDSLPAELSDQISRSVGSDSLRPHESQHARPPCPSPTPRVHSDSHPSSQWCHPAISSSVIPFSSFNTLVLFKRALHLQKFILHPFLLEHLL